MDDDLATTVLKTAGEVAADKALGADREDGDFRPFMERFPPASKFIIKTSVGLLSGAPVFTMMKLGRRFQPKTRR